MRSIVNDGVNNINSGVVIGKTFRVNHFHYIPIFSRKELMKNDQVIAFPPDFRMGIDFSQYR